MTAALMGHWFSLQDAAERYAVKQRRLHQAQQFTVLESDGGYLVVSDRQMKALQQQELARRNPKLL